MIEKIAQQLAGSMVRNEVIAEDMSGYYVYGMILLVEKAITYVTIAIVSIVLDIFFPTVVFMFFMLPLRARAGGVHTNHFYQCYVLSTALVIGGVLLACRVVLDPPTLWILLALAVIVVLVIGTVNNPNMDLDAEEQVAYATRARQIVLLETVIIAAAGICSVPIKWIQCMVFPIVACSAAMIIAKIIHQEVQSDEKGN